MSKIFEINQRKIPNLKNQYPLFAPPDKNIFFTPFPLEEGKLKGYDVIHFYRILKKIYGTPSIIELNNYSSSLPTNRYQLIKSNNDYEYRIFIKHPDRITDELIQNISLDIKQSFLRDSIDWKYLIAATGEDIFYIASKTYSTEMDIGIPFLGDLVNVNNQITVSRKTKIINSFINRLVEEIDRLGKQLLDPLKEIEEGKPIGMYAAINVYLANYHSGDLMLSAAEKNEKYLRKKSLKYDARLNEVLLDKQKSRYIHKYMLSSGMYYASAISYFFMALEGFVNLIYHALLIQRLRDRDFNLEQRFDLDQKIRLIPSLCNGFKGKYIDPKSAHFEDFKKLKNFRNSFFHSKIEDSVKIVLLIEDMFRYNVEMDKKNRYPLLKMNLTREDVLAVKRIVRQIINEIISKANVETKRWIKKSLLKDHLIHFYKDENGEVKFLDPGKRILVDIVQKNFDKFKISINIVENKRANE